MKHGIIRIFVVKSLLVLASWLLCDNLYAQSNSEPVIAASPAAVSAKPLPGGCPGNTPPGPTQVVCCISGLVYIDGQPVEGAEVEITNATGQVVRTLTQTRVKPRNASTQVNNNYETRPYYHIGLSGQPLRIVPGDVITLTARYSGREQTIQQYIAKAGGQQVDIVLPRNNLNLDQAQDYRETDRLSFTSSPGKFIFPSDIDVDNEGNLYVLDSKNARIQVYNSQGQFLRTWGNFGITAKQFIEPVAIAVRPSTDSDSETIVVLDIGRKKDAYNQLDGRYKPMILRFTTYGELLSTAYSDRIIHEYGSYLDGFDIAIGKQGEIWLTSSNGFLSNQGTIFQLSGSDVLLDFAQNADNRPWISLATDSGGNLFALNRPVMDQQFIVHKFNIESKQEISWPTNIVERSTLSHPGHIATDRRGLVYIWDDMSQQIQKYNNAGGLVASCSLTRSGNQLIQSPRIAVDKDDNIYLADNNNIYKVKMNNTCQLLFTLDNTGAKRGTIYAAQKTFSDQSGNLYVLQDGWIQKFSNDGTLKIDFGAPGEDDGQLYNPFDLIADSQGNIYVLDRKERIQKFNSEGVWQSTWISTTIRWSDPITIPEAAPLYVLGYPVGISTYKGSNIYVLDNNQRVWKLDSNGSVLDSWSISGELPVKQIVVDEATNTLYVASYSSIQKFDTDHSILDGPYPPFDTLRIESNEGTFLPRAMTLDGESNLYVAATSITLEDTIAPRIFKFDKSGKLRGHWRFRADDLFINGQGVLSAFANTYHRNLQTPRYSYIQNFRLMTYTRPIATLNSLSRNATNLPYTDVLVAYGQGQDSDETPGINTYEWTFYSYTSGQTQIFTTATPIFSVNANQLGIGTHRLTLRVQDNEAEWSEPVSTDKITIVPPSAPSWTFMLYLVGDYDNGESFDDGELMNDFVDALELISTTLNVANVRIAVLLDGPGASDTRSYLFGPGKPGFTRPEFVGELAMDQESTLRKFISDSQQIFPAEHYYLAIADHGQGSEGIAWDKTSGENAYLDVMEIRNAIGDRTIDVLHLDACSMALMDVAYELRSKANFLIVSQYLGWSYFPYSDYQADISTTTTAIDLARNIVEKYAKRADDDPKRPPYTLSALDLDPAGMDIIKDDWDRLSALLINWVSRDKNRVRILTNIREKTQKFNSDHDLFNTNSDQYVDLAHWLTNLLTYQPGPTDPSLTEEIRNTAQRLRDKILGLNAQQPLIIANRRESRPLRNEYLPFDLQGLYPDGVEIKLDNATGISVLYPINKDAFTQSVAFASIANNPRFDVTYDNYINERIFEFTLATRWDELLRLIVGFPLEGEQLAPPFGPLALLDPKPLQQIFLPIIRR